MGRYERALERKAIVGIEGALVIGGTLTPVVARVVPIGLTRRGAGRERARTMVGVPVAPTRNWVSAGATAGLRLVVFVVAAVAVGTVRHGVSRLEISRACWASPREARQASPIVHPAQRASALHVVESEFSGDCAEFIAASVPRARDKDPAPEERDCQYERRPPTWSQSRRRPPDSL